MTQVLAKPMEECMSRIDDLNNVLLELQASSGAIEACAVVSEDGLIMASSHYKHRKLAFMSP